MYRTLFHVPHEIPGIPLPVFGFGLVLAVWALFSLGLLVWLVRRQGFSADTWGYLGVLAVVALIVWRLLPAICEDEGLPIRGYGMMILLGVVAGTGLAVWRAWRAGLNPDLILSLAFWMFVPGIIGARAFYVIEYWTRDYWPAYKAHGLAALLGEAVNIAQGGLVIYGSFIGGMLGLLLFVRKYRLPLLAVGDLIAPSLMLGLALGRIGCLFNGCCFGHICEENCPWKVRFPWNSPAHVHQAGRGEVFLHGLKIAGDANGRPLIAEVEPGSPAEEKGLKPNQQVTRVGGIRVDAVEDGQPDRTRWALLGAHQLEVLINTEDGGQIRWTIGNPAPPRKPLWRITDGEVSILGMKIRGDAADPPVITEVKPNSPAKRQGINPGQQIIEINGRPVRDCEQLRALLQEQHTRPWLSIHTRDGRGEARHEWTIRRPLARSRPVHPTQIYSSINALLLCLLLLAYDPFRRRDGELFALMLSIYPIARFLLEIIRADEAAVFHTELSISQNISLLLLVCAAGLWFYILKRPRGTAFTSR